MSRTFRHDSKYRSHPKRPAWSGGDRQEFRCTHCKLLVGPPVSGGTQRNHCPSCLYSRHVDGRVPGDRAGDCGGAMAPVGLFVKAKGEQVLVHRCLGCGFERHNRVAADDNFVSLMHLPLVEPRTSGRGLGRASEDALPRRTSGG